MGFKKNSFIKYRCNRFSIFGLLALVAFSFLFCSGATVYKPTKAYAEVPATQVDINKKNAQNDTKNKKINKRMQFSIMSTDSSEIKNLNNDFIDLSVKPNGRFTLGTTGGNPDLDTDNNKKMLYGHPSPGSSFSTIRIDGVDYCYGAPDSEWDTTPRNAQGGEVVQSPSNQSETTNVSEYKYGNIIVKQTLSFIEGVSSNRKDTLEIKYRISNQDVVSHSIGLRIMLDTMLGENDGAPFKIPGIGDVTTEMSFTGNEIPQYWQAVDDLIEPGVIGQGTNATWQANRPDRFIVADWGWVSDTTWDYTCDEGLSIDDSAVGTYWNPIEFSPGETKEFVSYYGVSEFSSEQKDLVVNVTGPSRLNWENDMYAPNPFTVTTYITNNTDQVAKNVQAKITLPEGLALYSDMGSPEQIQVGDLNPGETVATPVTWYVVAGEQGQDTTLDYKITVTSDNNESIEVQRSVTIPESPFYQEPVEPVNPEFIVHRRIGLDLEQELSPRPHQVPEISEVSVTSTGEPGVYELYVSDYFVDASKGGKPLFFWSTKDGYFENQKIENYRKVIFHANPGTAGKELMVEVQLGDCLGNAVYYPVYLESAGEPSDGEGGNTLTAHFTDEPSLLEAWETYPIHYEALLKDGAGNTLPGTRVNIYYSTEESSRWMPIATDLIDRSRYAWLVPNINSNSVRLKLIATNGNLTAEVITDNFVVNPDIYIKGQVLDEHNQGIEGVKVTAGSREVYTDALGYYIINRLNSGSYTVTVNKEDVTFIRSSRDVRLSAANPSRTVNFHAR